MDPVGIPENCLNFSFGLDNAIFSDRTLLLEIINAKKAKRGQHAKAITPGPEPPQVKTIHINSLILAARSPFFLKLFSNGMLETEQKLVKLQIEVSEEASFMDLLKYFYSNNLPTTLEALLDLWIIANKYEVETCLRECSRSLQNLPITCESASLYLDLPPALLISPATIKPLIDKANKFLVEHFKDFHRCEVEMLELSLPSIEAVLSSDDLQVVSECDVYSFVLKWARKNYPNVEERREVLGTYLLNLVRFPFMTTTSLVEEVATCSDIDHELASKIVIRALHFKNEAPHRRRCLAAAEDTKSRQYVERAYKSRQFVAYHQLARKELTLALTNGQQIRLYSFVVCGIELELFYRFARIAGQPTNSQKRFFLGVEVVKSGAAFEVEYEIATRKKGLPEFESWREGSIAFTETDSIKYIHNLPWNDFIFEEKCFFINDIFHLWAEFTLIKKD